MKIFQAILLITVLAASSLAKDVWFEIKTSHFEIVGNTEEIREVAETLEQFHENFQRSFTNTKFNIPFPTKVLFYQGDTKIILPNQNFITADDANYIAISSDKNYADIFHFYANLLINNNLGQGKIPAWFNHGLAEYFANRRETKDLLIAQESNLSSLPTLLETENFTLQSQDRDRKALFNAQALAFLSFLLKEKGTGKFEDFEKLIGLFQSGKTTQEALLSGFQFDYKKNENEFQQFLKQPKILTKKELSPANKTFQIVQISEAKSLTVLGEFLFYANRPKEAMQFLERSLQIEPNSGFALSTLALVKAKTFYYNEAEELAENAIRIEPENYQNYYRYAAVLSKQGMTEYGFVSGYHPVLAEKMGWALVKAIALNSLFAESYALLAYVNYVRNEQIDESLKLLQKALDLAPANQRYLLRLSELNLRKENFVAARRDALEVLRTAPTESLRLYAQNTAQRIDSTEFQLNRIRNEKTKYVDDETVTEKPLSEDEIRRLREKAVSDQIRLALRRPKQLEKRVLASLTKIECGKEKVSFIFKTLTEPLKLQAKNIDEVNLLSFIEEMTDFRLTCGNVSRENYASIIYGGENKPDNLVSIEFVPKGFRLQP